MITGEVIGDDQVILRLERFGSKLIPEMTKRTERLSIGLQSHVKANKLSGQVLKVRTGTGRRSIAREVTVSDQGVEGRVGTNVSYMVDFETTGMPPHVIEARRKLALRFNVGGELIFRKKVNHPGSRPKPYLKPSLAEYRPTITKEYRDGLDAADP